MVHLWSSTTHVSVAGYPGVHDRGLVASVLTLIVGAGGVALRLLLCFTTRATRPIRGSAAGEAGSRWVSHAVRERRLGCSWGTTGILAFPSPSPCPSVLAALDRTQGPATYIGAPGHRLGTAVQPAFARSVIWLTDVVAVMRVVRTHNNEHVPTLNLGPEFGVGD